MEGELEGMREDNESNAGDASDAARRAKAELEIKNRELQDQVNEYTIELDKAKQQAEAAAKGLSKTKSELAAAQESVGESESLREKLELELQEKDIKIRSLSKGHSDQTEDDERHYKEQMEQILS